MYRSIKLSIFLLLFFSLAITYTKAQVADSIYKNYIKTVRFHNLGDQLSLPILNLNGSDQVELHFDDLDGGIKYYYYTFQLCNSDWKPVNLSQFDFLKGFTQMRINNYRFSSITFLKYTHYQATIPDRNLIPSRSGNYLLKVYLDGDTSKLAFTRRLLVVENKAIISGSIVQPFAPQYFRTHQRVRFNVNIEGLNAFSASQQVKVVILQNNRWDNALVNIPPTFVRTNLLEYNTEGNTLFAAGKEWRWLDIRDFRLQSDRVERAAYKKTSTEVFVKPDADRSAERYVYFRDQNGRYYIETTQSINPFWQSDYGMVHFNFIPPGGKEFADHHIYLFGQLTDYALTDSLKMKFNAATGRYETRLFLKQGYYNYSYQTVNKNTFPERMQVDGNYYETENIYTILVYYKPFAGRADELIGVGTLNSRTDRPGVSF